MNPDRELIEEALPGYEIGEELGRGAWGVVLSGRHRRLGRLVAIKQLPRAFAADPNVSARFLSEARMAASLEHPHIVPVYDYVEMDGLALIVMEQCPTTVAARFQAEGLGIDEACASALATCSALAYAHERQVLHRDIKPENLLIDQDGVVKLGDFGIARALDAATRLTATGTVMGTPAYMSPEQAGGEDLGPHSDVYSTGVVLYELLSGDFPFEEASSVGALLRQHLFEPPRPLDDVAPDVPEPIASVVDRALEKDPGDRWPSAVALGVALGEATAAAFGAAWPRRRGFALFGSPEIVAATERGGAGTTDDGTVAVSGAQRASSSAPVVPESSPAPSDQVDMSRATTAPIAGPVVTPSRSRRGLPIVIAAAALVLIVVVAGYLALSGGDDGSDSLASGDSSSVGGDGGSAVAPVGTSAGQLVIGTLIDSSGSQDGDQEAAVMLAVEEINEAGGVLGQPLAILSGRYDGEAALVLQA
ncbi:MAG: protein kinase [Acidimicrobiales bacterium]